MKTTIVMCAIAALLFGCTKDHHNQTVDPFSAPYSCGTTCYDCDGSGPTIFYQSPAAPVDCRPSDADVTRDSVCFQDTGDPRDFGQPRCFYNCDSQPACVRPTP